MSCDTDKQFMPLTALQAAALELAAAKVEVLRAQQAQREVEGRVERAMQRRAEAIRAQEREALQEAFQEAGSTS